MLKKNDCDLGTLYKIKHFCDENGVKIDIDFYHFIGVRIVMKLNGLCRSLTFHDNELLYNKVDILTVLDMMLKELKKKEEENEL